MECNRIQPGIDWEALSPEQSLQFRNHLKTCAICRRHVFSEAPERMLFEIQDPELPEDFWLGFWDSLEKRLDDPQPENRPNPAFSIARWAAVLVFALILALYSRKVQEPVPIASNTGIPNPAADSSSVYPLVEEVQNPNTRYYIFQPKGNENIVMMFDPDMEL